jgi:CRP-like cAMP-binding protein
MTTSDAPANRLLSSIPYAEWEVLRPHATTVTLQSSQTLFAHGETNDIVYFPITSVVSMIAEMANGDRCEYGVIGSEGMLGLQIALCAQPLRGTALTQIGGSTVRLKGEMLRKATAAGQTPHLERLLLRYAQATINVLAQSAACNALHPIYRRTARWLLLSRDRVGSDNLALTQEFLARMLGVRRASVTEAAARLHSKKIIEYDRGNIHLLHSEALEAESCECYRVIRDEYDRLFEGAEPIP